MKLPFYDIHRTKKGIEFSDTEKTATWVLDGGRLGTVYKYKCTNCFNRDREPTNYCSYCGLKMTGVENVARN